VVLIQIGEAIFDVLDLPDGSLRLLIITVVGNRKNKLRFQHPRY
jgi:hypothetical protein